MFFSQNAYKFVLSLVLSTAGVFAFATPKKIPLPMVKIPSRVQSLDWNASGTLFSHTEGNSIVVRNGETYEKIHDISINGGKIQNLKFATNFNGALEQLIMFSETSELSVFRFPETSATIIERLPFLPPPHTYS